MSYIETPKPKQGCVFCQALDQQDGPDNLIVTRGNYCFVILNRYPYTSGHLMVLPFLHVSTLLELDPDIRTEMFELAVKCTEVLDQVYHVEGFNIGANIGAAAGAGIEEHVHLHIVPRWQGDTNFMSSLGKTRVLPETLEQTYRRVLKVW